MSKLLVVLGATGNQGGSAISAALSDSKISKEYKIRAVTRDTTKPAATSLTQKGVEVVAGDANDVSSLTKALSGAHTVFGVTSPPFNERAKEIELDNGKAIADAAVAAGAKYLIFSSLPPTSTISGGKYTWVGHFDAKAEVEKYITGLPIKGIFYRPGSFMQNYASFMAPHPAGDGTYAISNVVSPQTQLPLVDIVADTGKFTNAFLTNPDAFVNKDIDAGQRLYTMQEIAEIMSKASGKTVKYNQLPVDVFKGFLPPGAAEPVIQMMQYFQDFGYYGPKTKELIESGATAAGVKLTTFEEYLKAHPIGSLA